MCHAVYYVIVTLINRVCVRIAGQIYVRFSEIIRNYVHVVPVLYLVQLFVNNASLSVIQ